MSDKQFGQPGHFICSYMCRFHLHTHLGCSASRPHGRLCVSTVGDFRPTGSDGPQPLGGIRPGEDPHATDYETMVFRLDESGETSDWSELVCDRYPTRELANAGHAEMCDRWRKRNVARK